MNHKKFFNRLIELYAPDFDRKGKWLTPYGVKFYCQSHTFTYEIYDQENAYHGKPIYKSDVFYHWHLKGMRKVIINDIEQQLNRL